MPSPDTTQTVTIASGQSISGAGYLGHGALVGVSFPAAWTTADCTMQGSMDGSTFQDLYDEGGTEYTIKAGAARHVAILARLRGFLWFKIRSGSSGSPTNQGAARVITLLVQKAAVPGIGR